jgi:hypothetical protein
MDNIDAMVELTALCRDLKDECAGLQAQLHAHRITLMALLQLHEAPRALHDALLDAMGDRPASMTDARAAEAGEFAGELVAVLRARLPAHP